MSVIYIYIYIYMVVKIYIYIYIYISSHRPKTMGVDYSCIEYMRNII